MKRINPKAKRKIAAVLAVFLIVAMVLSSVPYLFIGNLQVLLMPLV